MDHQHSRMAQLDLQQLKTLVPLKGLMDAHLRALLQESELAYKFAGDVLFEAGQYDPLEYFLLSGEVELQGRSAPLELLKGRTCLTAIGRGQPRQAQAKVCADAQVLAVNRSRLDQLLEWSQSAQYLLVDLAGQRQFDEDAAWLNTVLRSNLFLKVPPTNVGGILAQLIAHTVSAGDVILRQGEIGDCCYFIKEGDAEVIRDGEQGAVKVATLGAGWCFGEDALIQETVRNATVTMKTDGVLLVLQKADFLPLLKHQSVQKVSPSQCGLTDNDASSTHSNEGATYAGATMLDVRTEEEYNQGHLHSTANLPLHLLHLKHRLLDKEKRYITCCNSGARAATACYFLNEMGYDVMAMSEGVDGLAGASAAQYMTRQDFILNQGKLVAL